MAATRGLHRAGDGTSRGGLRCSSCAESNPGFRGAGGEAGRRNSSANCAITWTWKQKKSERRAYLRK
jgi:hypothetical protein